MFLQLWLWYVGADFSVLICVQVSSLSLLSLCSLPSHSVPLLFPKFHLRDLDSAVSGAATENAYLCVFSLVRLLPSSFEFIS